MTILIQVLFNFLLAFVRNLISIGASDPKLIAELQMISEGVAADHPDWSRAQRMDYIRSAGIELLKEAGVDVGHAAFESALNTLLELVHQPAVEKRIEAAPAAQA